MGIDPVTHKPKNDALLPVTDGGPVQSKNVANLSHIAQWESARLEAEARLARQSKLRSNASSFASSTAQLVDLQDQVLGPLTSSSLDVFKGWQTLWPSNNATNAGIVVGDGAIDMDSPTSTLRFLGNGRVIEFMNNTTTTNNNNNEGLVKDEGEQPEWNPLSLKDKGSGSDEGNNQENRGFIEGFTELLLSTTTTTTTISARTSNSSGRRTEEDEGAYNSGSSGTTTSVSGSDYCEDNKNYWDSILNLVNSSPPHSPMF